MSAHTATFPTTRSSSSSESLPPLCPPHGPPHGHLIATSLSPPPVPARHTARMLRSSPVIQPRHANETVHVRSRYMCDDICIYIYSRRWAKLSAERDVERARSIYSTALQRSPKPYAYQCAATLEQREGQLDVARRLFAEGAAKHSPDAQLDAETRDQLVGACATVRPCDRAFVRLCSSLFVSVRPRPR